MATDNGNRVRAIEFNKLTRKLHQDLKQDIARIYKDSVYSDLELVLGETSLKVNCCILQARAKSFYSQLISLQKQFSKGCDLNFLTGERLHALVRDVYNEDEIHTSESLVVEHLKHIACSPGSDLYVTPVTSPSEISEKEKNDTLESDSFVSYYSIVPVDWERELAEQDFLSQSFRSILIKERYKCKSKRQKSLSSNFGSFLSYKDSRSLLDLKRAVEEDTLLLQEEGVIFIPDSPQKLPDCEQEKVKLHIIHLSHRKSTDSCNECGFFDAEDSLSLCNESLIEMQKGESVKSKMSSNMDMGPDSGLATSAEDIPLDQDTGLEVSKSISSSVSSDCCVWDSSVGPQHSDLNSWVDCAPHRDSSGIQADFVDRVLEELVGKSQQSQDDVSSCTKLSEEGVGVVNAPKHSYFIDASSLLDETEINNSSAGVGHDFDVQNTVQQNIPHDTSDSSRHRTQNLHRTRETSAHSECTTEEEYAIPLHHTAIDENLSKVEESTKAISGNVSQLTQTGCLNEEDKPPSLIRSNTFELGSENDRLALLRQEYERRQGSLIFQRCISQPSGPLSDGASDQDQLHCTSLILPDSDLALGVANMSLFPTHVLEEEVQTPDSLNSDLLETVDQDKSNSKVEEYEADFPNQEEVSSQRTELEDGMSPIMTSLVFHEVSSPASARRKTDSAPILSGAAPPLSPESKLSDHQTKSSQPGPLASAWVVDISDIRNSPEVRRRKADILMGSTSEHLTSKADQGTPESRSLSSSFGFFVDLKDPKPSLDQRNDSLHSSAGSQGPKPLSDSVKLEKQAACEFFVDLNHPSDPNHQSASGCDPSHSTEKKLFSMFIDIGDKIRPKAKPDLTSRCRGPLSPFATKRKLLAAGATKQSNLGSGREGTSDVNKNKIKGASNCDGTPIEVSASNLCTDTKQNRSFVAVNPEGASRNLKTVSSSRSLMTSVSLNSKEKLNPRPQHVRAHSISSMRKVTSSDNSSLSSSSRHLSSLSLQNAEVLTYNDARSELKPMFSLFPSSLQSEKTSEVKEKKDHEEIVEHSDVSSHITTGSNESSACSLETYSVHTPEQSVTEDHSSQSLCITKEIDQGEASDENGKILFTQSSSKKIPVKVNTSELKSKADSRFTKSFVRLSDLDKEPISSSDNTIPAVTHRMTRSIPETSWIERKSLMSHSTGGSVMSGASRSLSRLFPNLSMHSASLGRSKTSSACSPLNEDLDTMRSSQVSDLSSLQSSAGLEYSTESTDISSDRGSPATQLGDDLLKMFLEEISTDVIVEVGGRRIKAHKCILSSRCQYFAAILSGGWVESAGNVISLQGFSYTVVHFALCHIYSGASTIPDQISIVELANLADMLSLEGLKDVIMYTLKVKYCHFFHKPCAVCSVGVLECLPLAAAYGLDDIYRKSLRWITKYFVRIWPTKAFTSLPREFIDKCYQQHVIHMTPENVLETILCCDKLLSTIPTVRWAESIFVLTSRLMETCIKFMSDNFCYVLASENFLSLGREVPWNVSRFQESIVIACERMPPDQSCRSYAQLCSVLDVIEGPDPPPEMTWHPNFVELLVQLRELSEQTLIRQATRAARTPGWGLMPTELRRKIQDVACLVLTPADHASSRYKRTQGDGIKLNSQHSGYTRNLDLHQVKMAMVQHARRTISADHHQTASSVVVRKSAPSDRSNTVSRRSAPAANTKSAEKSNPESSLGRPKTWPAQVKSRYLEKRPNHAKQTMGAQEHSKQMDAPVLQRRVAAPAKGMFISSSDSSRNSSPAMKRSSNVPSSAVKISDTNSRTRAATVTVCHSSNPDTSKTKKECGLSKSSDNISRRSLPVSKNQPQSDTLRTSATRKIKGSSCREMPPQDPQSRPEGVNSIASSTLGTQSQSVSMSNDSLATVSSSDELQPNNFDENGSVKISNEHLTKSAQNSVKVNADITKKIETNTTRTPLSLANKKASPSVAQRKMPLMASKIVDNNVTSSPSSLMSKRSISQVTKSPVLSSTVSRLAIPLRTSRSVSSVPDKGHLKANSFPVAGSVRKSISKDQSRTPVTAGRSKRASQASTFVSNPPAVGRVLSGKGSQANSCGSNNANQKNIDKNCGDSSLDSTGHPTVGPRSGTFLKDEPTVLKTPIVENEM